MKLRDILEAVASAILLLFRNVYSVSTGTWPMIYPLIVLFWNYLMYSAHEGMLPDALSNLWRGPYFWEGTLISLIGLLFFLVSLAFFSKEREGLVSTGIYGVVRHPQYLGLIAFALGASLVSLPLGDVPAAIETWTLIAYSYVLLAFYEDEKLAREYADYEEYRKNVSFIFPLIHRICKRFSSRFTEATFAITTILCTSLVADIVSTSSMSPTLLFQIMTSIVFFFAATFLFAGLVSIPLRKTISGKTRKLVIPVYSAVFLAFMILSFQFLDGWASMISTMIFMLLSLIIIENVSPETVNRFKTPAIVYSLFFVAILLHTWWILSIVPYSMSPNLAPPFLLVFPYEALALVVLVDRAKVRLRSLSIYERNSRVFTIISSILISMPILAFLTALAPRYLPSVLSGGIVYLAREDAYILLQLFSLCIVTLTMKIVGSRKVS